MVRVVDRRGDEEDLRWVAELAAVRCAGGDHPDVARLDRPRDPTDRDRATPLEHVADLVVRLVDVPAERTGVALEDEDARLAAVAQVGPLEDVLLA